MISVTLHAARFWQQVSHTMTLSHSMTNLFTNKTIEGRICVQFQKRKATNNTKKRGVALYSS